MFAERFKNMLEKKNISQTKLSEEIGCTQATISNWCNGSTEPDFTTLKYIAKRLNVTIDYLLGNDEVGSIVEEYSSFDKKTIKKYLNIFDNESALLTKIIESNKTDKEILKRYLSMTNKEKQFIIGIMNIADEFL